MRRRDVLKLTGAAGAGLLGLALTACGPSAPPPAPTSVPAAAAKPANAAPGQAGPSAAWDQLVSAAQKEGKVVVSGPPAPDARTRLPAAFKQAFNIDLEYLAGNTSQLASRIESERAAGQYTIDVSLSGPDTAYATFIPNKWLDPVKPVLLLPDVVDPRVWPKGAPWFRDPSGDTTMQIFNTISPIGYVNTDSAPAGEVTSTDDLLKAKWKGKIASYDPSVNGGGLIFGSVLYVTRGQEFAKQLFQGQEVAYTRDYQQIADWVAHDSYSIAIGVTPIYIAQYQGAAPLAMMRLSDVKPIVSGGFSIVSFWNQAPHPNAAKVFINWIASKEGTALYAEVDGSAPVRLDVDPAPWLAPELTP
ncbi:MAG TPA: extracellular solute-binding protein, partial [Chloroflexota bacterium]|nr:extracellular solute-binding protein [Chloroflexota bacterium]